MTTRTAKLMLTTLLLGNVALAQQMTTTTPQTTAPATSPAANSQAVANSGLLPIYGVELGVDKTWIDSANFPSQSSDFPNAGMNASFQQVWEGLKPAGFNFVRIGFDVYDLPASVDRGANACLWAQRNNVKLLLALRSSKPGDYASAAAAFVKALADAMKADAYKATYAQISAYELEPDLNNPYLLNQVSSQAKAGDLLLATAQQVRTTETQELQGSGTDATPILVQASFDYELISARAIAGINLTDDAYKSAYSSLVTFLKPLAASPNIDLIAVDWLPGTISAGGVDKPPVLMRSLASDLTGKQFLFSTGFSTAFHSADEQKQYYTMTFANLGDLRASGGAASPFVGVIYDQALNAKPPTPPDPALPQAVSSWNWQSKAGELAGMWSGQSKSDEMNWWLATVRSNMGLLNAQADSFNAAAVTPKGGMQALGQISSAVMATASPAASQMPAGAAVPGQPMPGAAMPGAMIPGQAMPGGMPGQNSGGIGSTISQSMQAKATQGLSGLLDGVMQKLGTMEQSGLNPMGRGNSGFPGGMGGLGQQSSSQFAQNAAMNMPSAPCPVVPTPDAAATTTGMPTDPSAMSAPAPCTPNMPSGFPAATSPTAGMVTPAAPAASNGMQNTNSAMPSLSPGIGLPTGSITLSKQDVTLQPANPTVGQRVQITANLHNQNTANAAGITILASGAKNAVLAEADGVQISASSAYSANLQWTPTQASSTPITLKVSDGTGTEIASVALDPVNVALAPVSPKVRAPIGSSTIGASSTGASATDAPAGSSAAAGASDSTAATTLAPLGFAKIGDLVAQNLVAGVPGSIVVPISDPLLVSLTNIRAVLTVDGKVVQTQSVPSLLPEQSRSIVFSNVVVAAGVHEAKVGVQLQRGGKSQIGTVTQSILVQPAAPVGRPAGVSSASASSHLRSLAPTLPTRTSATVASASLPTKPTSTGAATVTSNQLAQLTLRTTDLTYTPSPASPGTMVTFHVVVHNAGSAPAQTAALLLSLYADGKLVAVSQPAIQFSVGANASYQANWQAAMPAGRQVQLLASVSGGGTVESASGKASIVVQSAASTSPKMNAAKPGAPKRQ